MKAFVFVSVLAVVACAYAYSKPNRSGDCDADSFLADRYRLSGEGLPEVFIETVDSATNVDTFYNYRRSSLFYAASKEITTDNATTLAIHRDTSTGDHSLIILNGPPLENGDSYVRMSVEVSNLPRSANIAVRDDPETDIFRLSRITGKARASWAWKQPYSDGVAISMPGKDFCVDIKVLTNTYPTEWKFYSGYRTLPDVSV